MNWKKMFFVLLFVVIIKTIIVETLHYTKVKSDIADDATIFAGILKNTMSKGINKIALNKLTWFEWNKVCVYGPYSGPVYPWTENENIWTIVFYLKNEKEIPMGIGRGIADPRYHQEDGCFDNKVYVNLFEDTEGQKSAQYVRKIITFSNN